MKILVTGGTGYIGSHTVVELQKKGFEVIIVDNLSNSEISVVDAIRKITGKQPEFRQFDLCDEKMTFDCFEKEGPFDGIIHFAAFKAVGESVDKPLMYFHNNIVSLINLLRCVERFNTDRFVFSSSCTVYGQPEKLPVDETAPFQPAFSPYGKTKQMSEEILSATINKMHLNAIALRYFNPIGAHESALIGELPLGVPNNLVPFITQTAIGKRKQLKVFGDDYNTADGTAIRDYIHVSDLAKAHVVALERLINKKNMQHYEIFNLGTGDGFSVLDVVQTFEKVSGQKLNYEITKRRPGDVEKIWADTSLANNELGWKTEKSLEEMLSSAWNWEKRIAKRF